MSGSCVSMGKYCQPVSAMATGNPVFSRKMESQLSGRVPPFTR